MCVWVCAVLSAFIIGNTCWLKVKAINGCLKRWRGRNLFTSILMFITMAARPLMVLRYNPNWKSSDTSTDNGPPCHKPFFYFTTLFFMKFYIILYILYKGIKFVCFPVNVLLTFRMWILLNKIYLGVGLAERGVFVYLGSYQTDLDYELKFDTQGSINNLYLSTKFHLSSSNRSLTKILINHQNLRRNRHAKCCLISLNI